jgi:hypothetical protein
MSNGYFMLFPFLSRAVLSTALSIQPKVKYSKGATKPILTSKLTGHIGHDLLARPKTGFSPSNQSLLEGKLILAAFNEQLVSPSNPLNELIDVRLMRRASRLVSSGVGIDTHVHKALWTYLFASLWLRG